MTQALLALEDLKVSLAQMDVKDLLVERGVKAHKVHKAQLEMLVLVVKKEVKVTLEPTVQQVLKDSRAMLADLVPPGKQDLMVAMARTGAQALLELKVQEERQVGLEPQAELVLREPMDLQGQLEIQERLADPGRLDHRDQLEEMETVETQVGYPR